MKNIKRSFLIILASYVIIYLLVGEAPLYVLGGAIIGTVKEFFKASTNVGLIFWTGLIIVFMVMLWRIKNQPIKYIILIILFLLLYVVDLLFAEILSYETLVKRVLSISVIVLIKSIALSLIIYFDSSKQEIVKSTH